jgi:hypothetical protein
MFFNKEGYPYNFRMNDGIWNGKIFFEPSSTDIFKSLTLYTLESVQPISYVGNFDIINQEIYNDSGMTLSPGNYKNKLVTDILFVNQSGDFYTKWIYGDKFHRFFPKGTVVSFSGNARSGETISGEADFTEGEYYFTVLQTSENSIMISTTTCNSGYSFIYSSGFTFYVNSHNCVSVMDNDKSLSGTTEWNISPNEKISIVGSANGKNDGVYEVLETGYTMTRIFDYDLSLLNPKDTFYVDLTMLTERPILYTGTFVMDYVGGVYYATFVNGRNSNLSVGTTFICEDTAWNHLLGGSEYTIDSIITENIICTTSGITFSGSSYEEDDGTIENVYKIRMSNTYDIQVGWDIRFDSTGAKNDKLIKKVTIIESGVTYIGESGITYYDIYLDSFVSNEIGTTYTLVHVLKSFEQITTIVSPSIDNGLTYEGYARVLSVTNNIRFSQEATSGNTLTIPDAIDTFINRYVHSFEFNGIDIYRKDKTLFLEGRYSGQNPYFNSILYINTTQIPITANFSDLSGNTWVYDIVLKEAEDNLVYERLNMSNNLSQSYFADIVLNLFDDAQEYGFQLTINGVQYYVPYNTNSGGTTYTLETINSFINKYGSVLYNNGLILYSGLTIESGDYVEHLYVEGREPNVDIWEMKVKVNKNSTYTITETPNRFMMVTANKLHSPTVNFTDFGFSTGMILSISGSTNPLNDKEFNIIGISGDNFNNLELSFQGPMYTDTGVTLSLRTREFLRRPRETNDSDIVYRYRWEDETNTNMFLYDLSGENLVPWGNNPLYAYTGPKPLVSNYDTVYLNREPNKSTEYVNIPSRQQTVFNELNFTLERFDNDNASILPNPIQTFIGYNNKLEGVDQRNLIIERVDNVVYSGYTSDSDIVFVVHGNTISMFSGETSFLELGFRTNRYLRIKFVDNKPYTQYVFEDYQDYLITNVTNTRITVDQELTDFSTYEEDFKFEFILLPERIAFFRIYGETEEEDERLEANMRLLGISLTEEDEFIFKQSDVTEDGIDYRLLNRKRKEMMNIFPEIYNYIGSYRAILNAIDFFGYTDVQLVEYYRNIKVGSPYYQKLKRVVIPELLDRTVDGWTFDEQIPNPMEYVKTSLLNLTYRITDEEGNNVLLYSLKEVQTKLNGLKKWLRRNVIPVNANIRDITGVSEAPGVLWKRYDTSNNFTKNVVSQNNESVNINYTATRNFNNNWLVSLRFYTISSGGTSDGSVPDYWYLKVMTFTKDPSTGQLYPQQRWDDERYDLSNFNFSINWDGTSSDYSHDRFFYVETTRYNDQGVGKTLNKMYRLEDGTRFYFDEFKNYTLVNNNFRYKTFPYVQNIDNVYIIDEDGNFWIVSKEIQANR